MRMTARRSVVSDPCAAFAVLRATGVLVCGPSDAIRATMRALTRVGVGRIAVPGTGAGVPAGIGAAVVVVRADEPADGVRRLVRAVPVVPAVVGGRALVAGPVLRSGAAVDRWDAARATAGDPVTRPTAAAFVGSLAARLLVESLTGLAADGMTLTVPGDGLVAERVPASYPEVRRVAAA